MFIEYSENPSPIFKDAMQLFDKLKQQFEYPQSKTYKDKRRYLKLAEKEFINILNKHGYSK